MNINKTAVICAGVLVSGHALANNGDQMVGLSGISHAMAGAVVAMPQDVTTALSNPAGLSFVNLGDERTRFDMNLAVLNPQRSMNGVDSDSDAYVMATGGFAFESELFGSDFTVSVGAYPVSGGGVDFPAQAFKLGTGNAAIVASRMSLRIGPAVAYRVSEQLSVGANISLVANQMSIKNFDTSSMPPKPMNFPSDVAYGGAFVLGTVYRLTERTQFGAAYTSRSHTQDLVWNMDDGKWRLSFQDPQTIAIGVSHRLTDTLQVEADLKWLNYSNVRTTATLYGPTASKDKQLAYGWDDQFVFALNARYRLSDRIALMAGYNYGKSPIDEEDINNNAGVTAIVEHHLSVGLTTKVTRHSSLTLSLNHGFENDMTASMGPPTHVSFETNLATLQFTYQH